ncbi:hypothetical protein BS78_01G268400 [Paspalum vaginatum]|uniref:Uncharacterized protein n=1 Tax=Paspalum vaginatum TaxID=158149 RepID=A0A9W8CEA4_9POAL|nr:hypothetical protein BS78_K065800 [Paspalum vaginatum]KAJ1296038.1 hypothetical protein BS78_01G268400 [Paspalum vaginatum]
MASAPPALDQAPAPAMASSAPALDPVPAMASCAPALDPVPAMASVRPAPSPSPAPPAVEVKVEEERSWLAPMKLAPYAIYRVFRGMGSAGDDILAAAYVGIYVVLYVAQFLSLSAVPDRARFWSLIYTVVVCTCVAANALIIGVFIHNYMEFDPSKQQQQQAEAAASELLLPPPPPEMDMC